MNPAQRFLQLPPSIRIAIYYLFFACVWIITSDRNLGDYQTFKGLAFVTVSAGGLGFFIHRAWRVSERTERRFQAVVENAGDVITIIDRNGTQIYQSPAMQRILGYRADEMIGRNIAEQAHPEDRGPALQFLQSIMATPGAVGSTELRVFTADGSVRHLHSTATNLLDDPSVGGIVLNTRDITSRKLADQQMAQQVERLRALHEIDLAILDNRDIQETLDVVLQHVTDKLGVDAVEVLLYDSERQTLEFARGAGFRTVTNEAARLPISAGAAGHSLQSRQTRIIEDLRTLNEAILPPALITDEGFVGYAAIPLIAHFEVKGVLELFKRSPLDASDGWRVFADALGAQTAIAIESAQMLDHLQLAHEKLEETYDRTLEGWAAALELCDDETEGHSRRVVALTLDLAEALGIGDEELDHIRRGALLHDIGKIGVPDTILLKPEPLSDGEWEIMKQHPTYAYELLRQIPYLHPALDIPHYHHERWDGSGYPDGLAGEEIPLHARIFMVVDVYDALVSDRPYRRAWSPAQALDYIHAEAGKLFDPAVCDAFLTLMGTRAETTPLDRFPRPIRPVPPFRNAGG